jgi:hypothetical protein
MDKKRAWTLRGIQALRPARAAWDSRRLSSAFALRGSGGQVDLFVLFVFLFVTFAK